MAQEAGLESVLIADGETHIAQTREIRQIACPVLVGLVFQDTARTHQIEIRRARATKTHRKCPLAGIRQGGQEVCAPSYEDLPEKDFSTCGCISADQHSILATVEALQLDKYEALRRLTGQPNRSSPDQPHPNPLHLRLVPPNA